MLIPFAIHPSKVADFDPRKVATVEQDCLCGKRVALRDCNVVWTHKVGETDKDNGYYAFCNPECYVRHITVGNG